MANSKRLQILNLLRDEVLARITTGNGYNNTLKLIRRGYPSIDNFPDSKMPAVFVARVSESRKNITKVDFQSEMSVTFVAYIKRSGDIEGLQADIDNIVEDITKAINTDLKMIPDGETEGLARWTEVVGVASDFDDQEAKAAVAVTAVIDYVSTGVTP